MKDSDRLPVVIVDSPVGVAPQLDTLGAAGVVVVPALIADAGPHAGRRFIEFFVAQIRNRNTRLAYAAAVARFCQWCECRQLRLEQVQPVVVAAYVEELGMSAAAPTVKQHLAAMRVLFDWLVTGQIIPVNPAASVRGPRHIVKRGKTPVLTGAEAKALLESIDVSTLVGLRDRGLIGVMIYSFARVSAVLRMSVRDYFPAPSGKRWWLRLHEKGGKHHEVPAHHLAEAYLDAYIKAADIVGKEHGPLFRSANGRTGGLTDLAMDRRDALRMIKRRSAAAGLLGAICCHTFRATGITAYLENGGTIEKAQAIAAHESPRTTKLYDRTTDEISLEEIERIRL